MLSLYNKFKDAVARVFTVGTCRQDLADRSFDKFERGLSACDKGTTEWTRNAVIMRGFAARWHSRDLELVISYNVAYLCVNGVSALVPTRLRGGIKKSIICNRAATRP